MSRGIRADIEKLVALINKRKILDLVAIRGKATFKEFLEALNISTPTLAKYIKELEDEGMLIWQRNPKDRRSGYYMITEKVKKSNLIHLQRFEDFFRHVLAELSDSELIKLDRMIHREKERRLSEYLDKMREDHGKE